MSEQAELPLSASVAETAAPSQELWRGEVKQLSWNPRSFLLKGFLSDKECEYMINKVLAKHVPNIWSMPALVAAAYRQSACAGQAHDDKVHSCGQ